MPALRRHIIWLFIAAFSFTYSVKTLHVHHDHHGCAHHCDDGPAEDDDGCGICKYILSLFTPASSAPDFISRVILSFFPDPLPGRAAAGRPGCVHLRGPPACSLLSLS